MLFEVKNYNFLLDNLRKISETYHINNNGEVIDKDGDIEINEYMIINTRFCNLYCNAYKELAEEIDNCKIDGSNPGFIERALSDYRVFNSFVNNCVIEYIIYKDFNTGNISYMPNGTLSRVCFSNKEIVYDYLKCELGEVFNKDKVKELRYKF